MRSSSGSRVGPGEAVEADARRTVSTMHASRASARTDSEVALARRSASSRISPRMGADCEESVGFADGNGEQYVKKCLETK